MFLMKQPVSSNRRHQVGYRSGLEDAVAADLKARGVDAPYEPEQIEYTVPCSKHKYTPDFRLPNGIYIETKGFFTPEDRKKHINVHNSRPDLDIRFVFQNPHNKLRKGSPTTYAMWCEKNGFLCAAKRVPDAWIKEKTHKKEKLCHGKTATKC